MPPELQSPIGHRHDCLLGELGVRSLGSASGLLMALALREDTRWECGPGPQRSPASWGLYFFSSASPSPLQPTCTSRCRGDQQPQLRLNAAGGADGSKQAQKTKGVLVGPWGLGTSGLPRFHGSVSRVCRHFCWPPRRHLQLRMRKRKVWKMTRGPSRVPWLPISAHAVTVSHPGWVRLLEILGEKVAGVSYISVGPITRWSSS